MQARDGGRDRRLVALITPAYAEEQRLLHQQDAYGSRGYYWAHLVAGIASLERCRSIVDYGSGKGTLGIALRRADGLHVTDYDPAIPKAAMPPPASDLVVSVDTLEHIEPDCVGDVIHHIAKLTRKLLFVVISTRPAKRWLTDGRNTHLIVEDGDTWWRPRFEARGLEVRRIWHTALPEWVCLMKKAE
jgi:hypothetical protein